MEALSEMPPPTARQRRFLQAHADAPARTSTATILSKAAGYKTFGGLNLKYGALAARLGEILEVYEETKLALVVDFVQPKAVTNSEWLLVMKPEFAEALRSVGWID